MILNIKVPYAIDDLIADIVSKNKYNIEDLYEKVSQTPSQNDLDEINKLIGSYQADDPNGQLDSNQSIIANLVVVKENLTSALNRIKSNEERLTTMETVTLDNNSRIGKIEPILKSNTDRIDIMEPILTTHTNEINKLQTDGVGSYLGTYKGTSADNFEVLPTPANDQERAIIEFDDNGEIMYQEYKWLNNQWGKLGVPLDSHIHSQGAGITLQDVANQQDPKNTPFHTVKNLTNLTTQAEIYNEVEQGDKLYSIKINGRTSVMICGQKTATIADLHLFSGVGVGVTSMFSFRVIKGAGIPYVPALTQMEVGTPTLDNSATPKKYVDEVDKVIRDKQKWISITGDLSNYEGDLRVVIKENLNDIGIYKGTYNFTYRMLGGGDSYNFVTLVKDSSNTTTTFIYGYINDTWRLVIGNNRIAIDPTKYSLQGRLN